MAPRPATFFDLPYASYAFDLIAGPDNWRLIAPGAGRSRDHLRRARARPPAADETREVLIWAAHYAASTKGRGLERVGLANAPSAPGAPRPTRPEVLRRLGIVAEASRLAAVEPRRGARRACSIRARSTPVRRRSVVRAGPPPAVVSDAVSAGRLQPAPAVARAVATRPAGRLPGRSPGAPAIDSSGSSTR